MSRQIKFKVWDAGRKEWLHKMPFHLYGECTLMGMIDRREDNTSVKCAELNDLVPLQFTGLKDKNGAEIFEGDIVRITDCNGESCVERVAWNYQLLAYLDEGSDWKDEIEIIGNIYENPELLEPL